MMELQDLYLLPILPLTLKLFSDVLEIVEDVSPADLNTSIQSTENEKTCDVSIPPSLPAPDSENGSE